MMNFLMYVGRSRKYLRPQVKIQVSKNSTLRIPRIQAMLLYSPFPSHLLTMPKSDLTAATPRPGSTHAARHAQDHDVHDLCSLLVDAEEHAPPAASVLRVLRGRRAAPLGGVVTQQG